MLERVAKYQDVFLLYANKLTSNKEDAEDLLQDLYIKLHEKTTKLTTLSDQHLKSYVFKSIKNTYINNINKKKIIRISGMLEEEIIEDKTKENELDDEEEEVIKGLTYLEREILLSLAEKESYRSIAKRLGVSTFPIFQIVKEVKERCKENKKINDE